jgi:murein DD-endopeptidase MepM/ murein hydrolase activator NlpD
VVAVVLTGLFVAALVLASAGDPAARAAGSSSLQQQISSARQRASGLGGQVAAAKRRVATLSAGIASLSGRLAGLESDLNVKRGQLQRLNDQLRAAQARLHSLETAEAGDQQVLAQQLVGSYEGDQPDIVTVVLESTGFNDLLERLQFAQRIGHHDAQIVGAVKAARRAVATEAIRIGALTAREQRIADEMATERNRVDAARIGLISQRLAAARDQAAKASALTGVRNQVTSLSTQLTRLQAAQRAAAVRSAASPAGSGPSGGSPSAPVSGGFEFPMPKADVSPPGTWSLDDGVDIAAPGGTPELAVCSGTVVLHGIGGFGPSAPVLHCDSALAGYDYVYYGHAGPGNWTPIGAHVSQGQAISQVGYGIVGISTGPHLEIGFADSSGSPVGPSSAPTMMSLLRGAYGG